MLTALTQVLKAHVLHLNQVSYHRQQLLHHLLDREVTQIATKFEETWDLS